MTAKGQSPEQIRLSFGRGPMPPEPKSMGVVPMSFRREFGEESRLAEIRSRAVADALLGKRGPF